MRRPWQASAGAIPVQGPPLVLTSTHRPLIMPPPSTGDEEAWASVPGFPHYHVSTQGRVWREAYEDTRGRSMPAKEITPRYDENREHVVVDLWHNGTSFIRRVARLMMLSLGPTPEHTTDRVRKSDPDGPLHIDNLRWEAPRTRKKLTKEEALEIYRAAHGTDSTHKEIAAGYGITAPTVSSIKNGYTWSRVTGHKR